MIKRRSCPKASDAIKSGSKNFFPMRALYNLYVASPPAVARLTVRKRIAFGWYGGKFSHLEWLLPLLPTCHHYCEPFAGSAAVLLNRPPSPVETYNDLDGEVCNFFRVLRDNQRRLVAAIALTPFSRQEFAAACQLD